MSLINNREPDRGATRQVREWARELWRVGESGTVSVTELACSEPDCPPIETVVLISRGPGDTVQHKVHKPAALVTAADLRSLAERET